MTASELLTLSYETMAKSGEAINAGPDDLATQMWILYRRIIYANQTDDVVTEKLLLAKATNLFGE